MRSACPTASWFPRCRLSGTQPWSRALAMRALSRVVLARTSRRPSLTPEVVPHAGQTQVCQLDQMKRIDSDVRVRQGRGDRLPERSRWVDRHDLDAVPPGLAASAQPPGDRGAAPAVNDSEDLPRSGIDQGRHPRFDPPPPAGVGVAEPADPTVTVLVDPQAAYVEVVDPAKQHVDGGVDALVDRPPGDPKSGRDTSNGSAVSPTRPDATGWYSGPATATREWFE